MSQWFSIASFTLGQWILLYFFNRFIDEKLPVTRQSKDIPISAKGDGINYITTSKGAGKNELDATIKAIQKADLSNLQSQLKKHCE